jgi:hypothetical protein
MSSTGGIWQSQSQTATGGQASANATGGQVNIGVSTPNPPPSTTGSGSTILTNAPQKGQVYPLAKGIQIRTGAGFGFPSTIPAVWGAAVPEDKWLVLILNDPESPQCVDGWEWWNVDRGAVDHFGGTGWAAIRQLQCSQGSQPPAAAGGPSTDTGYVLGNGIRAKYNAFKGSVGPLGDLKSNEFDAAKSPTGIRGRVARFSRGSIYWSAEYGAHAIYDQWGNLYEDLGGTGSWLGFPTSDLEIRDGKIAIQFEGGYIAFDGLNYRTYRTLDVPPPDLSSPPEAAASGQLANGGGNGLLVVAWDDLVRMYPDLHQRYDELKPWIQSAYIAVRGGQCVAPMVPLVAVAAAPGGGGLAVYGLVTNMSYNPGCQILFQEAEKQLLGVNTILPRW